MMLRRNDRNLENIPVGALGLIALDGIFSRLRSLRRNIISTSQV